MKSSTFILVGAFVATGAIVYQGTMAGASQRPADNLPAAAETELARSQSRTPTPPVSATAIPAVVAAKTPALKLTLDQVRQLPRPSLSGGGQAPPWYPAPGTLPPAEPTQPPLAEVPADPPSTPAAATPPPASPTPLPTPDPWAIPTPPPFPPPPDNWVQPRPPTEE